MKRKRHASLFLSYMVLVLASLAIIGPLFIMMFTSIKSNEDFITNPIGLPDTFYWRNYVSAWINGGLLSNASNSLILTSASVAAIIATSALASFAIARIRVGRLSQTIFVCFIAGLILPGQVGLIPLFMQMQQLGLYDTIIGLILIYTAQGMPITIFIFTKFYKSIPYELDESAKIDGASGWKIFFYVVFPLVLPATVTGIILNMIGVWNDFFTPLIFISDMTHRTLPLGLVAFKGQFSTDWPQLFAASTMIALPILLVYVFLQRYMIEGITAGAVKG